MQVQMPFERAKETLREVRAFPRPPKVVVVTMFEEPRYVRELTGLGASAYLLKSSSAEHLIAAVRGAVFDPNGKHKVVGRNFANNRATHGRSLGLRKEGRNAQRYRYE